MLQAIYLILTISLSGTAAFLLYLAAVSFLDAYISAGTRYLCLKICMLFFLVPFPLLKSLLSIFLSTSDVFSISDVLFSKSIITVYPKESIILTADGVRFPFLTMPVLVVFGIWGVLLLAVLGYGILRFLQFYRLFQQCPAAPAADLKLLSHLKAESHITASVRLYRCDAAVSPFTCSTLRPSIFLTSLVDEDSLELTLRHELQHIRTHDFFFRCLAAVLLLLHCFNPFAYILFRELTEVQEMNCDEQVLRRLPENERKKYGHMVIDFALCTQKLHPKAICFSRNNTRFLKKRICKIASNTRKKRFLSPALLILLCLTAGIPAAAYRPSIIDWRTEEDSLTEDDIYADYIDYEFIDDPSSPSVFDPPADEQAFSTTDAYLLTDTGEVIPLSDIPSQRAACRQHTWKSGVLKYHTPNGKNCTVKAYNAVYCSRCHTVRQKTLTGTTSYAPCPHR